VAGITSWMMIFRVNVELDIDNHDTQILKTMMIPILKVDKEQVDTWMMMKSHGNVETLEVSATEGGVIKGSIQGR